jgi:hypothetical protein
VGAAEWMCTTCGVTRDKDINVPRTESGRETMLCTVSRPVFRNPLSLAKVPVRP